MSKRAGILINDPREALRTNILDDLQMSAAVYRQALNNVVERLASITQQEPEELISIMVGEAIYDLGLG